ncbi:MAG: ORF6N domain-containing protein [Akkermansiaceae bacterium]
MPPKKKTARKVSKKAEVRSSTVLIPEKIEPLVLYLRREKVLLDADLAQLYGVETRVINQAIKRNPDRFPSDFMFQLDEEEWGNLKSQNVISSSHGGRRMRPYAFTEQGVAMLSSVLRSPRAVEVNIAIMRTFVQLRRLMDSNKLLAEKIEKLEKKYDENFGIVFDAIRQLIAVDSKPKRKIGFHGE